MGKEECVSTLIKNVDSMYAVAVINCPSMAISLRKVMGCYSVKFKGYMLMYFLTGLPCFQP